MLHLCRRITLGVDIGDFLELQSTLEGHRIAIAASEIKEIARIGVNERQTLYVGCQLKHLLHKRGKLKDPFAELLSITGSRVFLSPAMVIAGRVSTITCPVKAFVDATPISGPTWI